MSEAESKRYRTLRGFWKVLFVVSTLIGLFTTIYYVLDWTFLGVLLDVGARYLAIGAFLPLVFLKLPAWGRPGRRVPWYDAVLAFTTYAVSIYLFFHAWDILWIGWTNPTTFNLIVGVILCLLVLEGGRRTGGPIYTGIALVLGIFPLFADKTPGLLRGISHSFSSTIAQHAFGSSMGIVGLPSALMVNLLIGFLIFAGMLLATGGGKIFLDLANSLLGGYRGGPAKVAVLGSGFFGSMSGSAMANVVGVGSFTIPAMKKLGYPDHYAGAIEACASCGGILMPPVMGAVAFVMAQFLSMPYGEIIICAAIPALLYYFGLLLQVDCYAARVGLQGLPKSQIPRVWSVVKRGWHFGIAFGVLIWGLLYLRQEAITPFYASIALIVLSMFSKETRIGVRKIIPIVEENGRIIMETMGILLPIALISGGLTITGVAPAFTQGLVAISHGNAFIALILGTIACFVLGMMGMVTPAYIFLAIGMAPALVMMGMNQIAVHLFIIYWAMLAGITPPVATVAFVGANIAGASPMKTAITATRLAIVIYFIPFFFVYNPSLIFRGTLSDGIVRLSFALLGSALIAAGVENYLWRVGSTNWIFRLMLIASGLLFAFPTHMTDIYGASLGVITIVLMVIFKRMQAKKIAEAGGSGSA